MIIFSIKSNYTHKGIAALMVVVIVGSAALIMGLASSARGLNTLELSVLQSKTEQIRLSAESCVEEALLQLYRNPFFGNTTLFVEEILCTIEVSGSGNTRILSVRATQILGTQYTISIVVTQENGIWRITQWNE